MAAKDDKAAADEKAAADNKTDQPSAEVLARRAMGKSDTPDATASRPARSGSGGKSTVSVGAESGEESPGNAFVPAAGGDPDSIQRAIKQLPEGVREVANLGADDPDELAAQRAEYGAAVDAGGYHGGRLPKDMSDEEKANVTGQPIGDGKSTGAVGTSSTATEAEVAASRRAAASASTDGGESRVQGRRATPGRQTTAKDTEEK